ncbi:hypothetical protein EDB83DRAFT_2314066 [Lactarius deliciosus]|nr:hypothetical protein EDB83DRAFT_2314066 [Lactarius deliciosus]
MPTAPRPPRLSLLPCPCYHFCAEGGARGHAAAAALRSTSPPGFPFSLGRTTLHATPGPSLPHSRGRGGGTGAPPLCVGPVHPFPHVRATPFVQTGGVRGQTTPPLHVGPGPTPSLLSAPSHSRGKGTCEAPLPPSLFAPPRSCGKGARDPRPLLSPLATPPRTRGEREGTLPPVPPFPIRAEGGCTRARHLVHAGRGA